MVMRVTRMVTRLLGDTVQCRDVIVESTGLGTVVALVDNRFDPAPVAVRMHVRTYSTAHNCNTPALDRE